MHSLGLPLTLNACLKAERQTDSGNYFSVSKDPQLESPVLIVPVKCRILGLGLLSASGSGGGAHFLPRQLRSPSRMPGWLSPGKPDYSQAASPKQVPSRNKTLP